MCSSSVRVSEGGPRWGALLAIISCVDAFAQQPEQAVSVEADSVFLDLQRGGNVFTGLTVTDGAVSIDAAEGVRTSEGDDGVWDFRAGLRVTIDVATLTADSGTLRDTGGKFTQVELLGAPVTLDGAAGSPPRPFRLTAGRISYDEAHRVLTASEGALFASDGLEVRDCRWMYDLSERSVTGVAEGDRKCAASVVVDRPSAQ